MTPQSHRIMEDFQIRKSRKQKEAFRNWLCEELEKAGYTPRTEKSFAAQNVVVGDPENAKVIFSAHYDTCAVLPIPNFITPRNIIFYVCYQLLLIIPLFLVLSVVEGILLAVAEALQSLALLVLMPITSIALCAFFVWWIIDGPANRHTANDNTSGVITLLETALSLRSEDRKQVCFVFFDNEEKGMFGVSDGDSIQFFPGNRLRKDEKTLERIETAFQGNMEKQTEVVRGFGFYPSDNASFKKGVGVCALKHKKIIGYYMDRIHTNRDTVLEEENIELLRQGALALAAGYREEAA